MKILSSGLIAAAAVLAACGDDEGGRATATFLGMSGQSVEGAATFTQDGAGGTVRLVVEITAGPPGTHGIHIHEVPSCGNNGLDAGPHWDPEDTSPAHHHLPPGDGHLGDLGNIEIGADGVGSLAFSHPAWTLGDGAPTDVLGHAIILHAMTDDGSMPSAGARWGCALIVPD